MSNKKKKWKKGDVIVHFGKIHKIFKIEEKKIDDKKEKVIFFKPVFDTKETRSLVCSIPVSNIEKIGIRKPISKKKLQKFLKSCEKKKEVKSAISLSKAKKIIVSDDLDKIFKILKRLWSEKHKESINFTKSREKVFKNTIKRLRQEVAYIKDISLRDAGKEIRKCLRKAIPETSEEK